MKHTITAGLAVLVTSLTVQGAEPKTGPDTPAVKLQSPWLNLRISLKQPAFEMIAVEGAFRDPVVHYDGKKVFFSYRKGGTHHYNLYSPITIAAPK